MSNLTYKLATLGDFEDFYRIKCDKVNIAWSGFTQAPEKKSFYEWYQRQLASDHRWIYLVYEGQKCCAFFYVDKLKDGNFEAASSGVLSDFMGKGIGTYALAMQIFEIQLVTTNGGGRLCRGCQTRTLLPISGMRNWASSEWMSSKLEIYHFLEASINFING